MNHSDSQERMKILGISITDIPILLLGAGLLFFLGWQWNNPLAAWFAPLFLITFFRRQDTWVTTLVALPILLIPLWLGMRGLWPMALELELLNASFRLLPFLLALYLDRYLARYLSGLARTLVYPSAFVVADFLMSVGPGAGSVFSPAATQFAITPLIQLSAVTGIWGITFLTGWFASTAVALWENDFDLKATRKPVALFTTILIVVLFLGAVRTAQFRPSGETVRIGSVAIDSGLPYWDEIDDANPRSNKAENAPGYAKTVDQLFASSKRMVSQGAKIIFWGEGNAPMYEDDEAAFLDRAKRFAMENNVYLLPAMLVLYYDQEYVDNKVVMIGPDGELLFDYEKTKTSMKTNTDGVLPIADTPYGRISAAICFDMDYPTFANQLGTQGVDIMLVPSWDEKGIKPFHTEVGAFRAVENGFSSVRGVVNGSSMAVDYHGNVLAYQDFFTVEEAAMIADVPIKGTRTLYGMFGDWFAYLSAVTLLGLILVAARKPKGFGTA